MESAPGTLTFGVENEFAGFEVSQSASRLAVNGAIAANTIMEPLFREDAEGGLIPVLGLSALESEDGRQWTITLRQGVRFHDGTPFNADAVVAHWQRMFDPENKFRGRGALDAIEAVEKAGDDAVVFRLKHRWLPFRRVITNTRSLINLIPSPLAVAKGTQNRTPVGTGPFQFKAWQAGDQFVVEKNPAYWQTDRLPEPLRHRSGHWNSHCFLTHEFVDAIVNDRQPVNNLYEALAYTAPGIVAHESALQEGERMKIPSFDR